MTAGTPSTPATDSIPSIAFISTGTTSSALKPPTAEPSASTSRITIPTKSPSAACLPPSTSGNIRGRRNNRAPCCGKLSFLAEHFGPPGIRAVQRAESPIAAGEFADGFVKIIRAEVGPQHRADKQLGITDLPKKIIADPHLPGGADQQIRVGHAGGV